MNDHASTAPVFASPAAPLAPSSHSWGERLTLRVLGLPTYEEAERRLRDRERQRERQREVSEFRDHPPLPSEGRAAGSRRFQLAAGGAPPSAGFQWPLRLSASATSGGM